MISELEKQYSPSKWQKRYPENKIVEEHLYITRKESEKVRSTIPNELNIRYGNGQEQLFDLYGKDLPQDAPILVYFHGGYWQEIEKDICANLVAPLYSEGVRVAVFDYDKAPKATLGQIVDEVKEAGKFILDLANTLGSRGVWFSGHSAGAHLIACLLTSQQWIEDLHVDMRSLIRGFIMISGVYSIEPLVKTYINEPLKLTSLDAVRFSPFHNFKSLKLYQNLDIKFLITVGEYESKSFKDQAKKFTAKLSTCYKGEMKIIQEIDHFNIIENLSDKHFCLTQDIIKLITQKKP